MISIITINYNNATGLERTLKSIEEQTYRNFELIIVDGGSTDEFSKIVTQYSEIITRMVSEKDRGISHAFNKGIHMSKGNWLLFLNSGDYFADKDALKNAITELDIEYDFVQFNVFLCDNEGKVLLTIPKHKGNKMYSLAHQGIFHNRNFFDKAGDFSECYRIIMDYDMELRLKDLQVKYCDYALTYMPNDGVSNRNVKRVFRENLACYLLNLPEKKVLTLILLYYYRLLKFYIKVLLKACKIIK